MYFYREKGKVVLDLTGDLILTHNDAIVKCRISGAAPKAVRNAKYIKDIPSMSAWRKLKASIAAVRFIWGTSEALVTSKIKLETFHYDKGG